MKFRNIIWPLLGTLIISFTQTSSAKETIPMIVRLNKVAGNLLLPNNKRAEAIIEIFDEPSFVNRRSCDMPKFLINPTWLKECYIQYFPGLPGKLPKGMEWHPGESLFCLYLFPAKPGSSTAPYGIYFTLTGTLYSADPAYQFFNGKLTDATTLVQVSTWRPNGVEHTSSSPDVKRTPGELPADVGAAFPEKK